VLVNAGRPQRFGTQIDTVVDGLPVPWPCENPDALDERRRSVGLPPWPEYVAAHRARAASG